LKGDGVRIDEIATFAEALDGVRRSLNDERVEWRYRGRLVARQLDDERLVLRCGFDERDGLVRTFPDTFSVPPRYRKHMMIMADLRRGDAAAIEEAVGAAWILQRAARAWGPTTDSGVTRSSWRPDCATWRDKEVSG
jgi:hypothetical protein